MKTTRTNQGFKYSTVAIAIISALASTFGYAAMDSSQYVVPVRVYAGVFGGVGSPSDGNVNQYGTAFFTEAEGGPLAVNAFGTPSGRSEGLGGAKVGMQWSDIVLCQRNGDWAIAPAVELQGFYMGSNSFKGDLINDTARLPEHDFLVTLPTQVNVYLMNAIINFNVARLGRFHPYFGLGLGGALSRINGATAMQVSPPEAGVNHFNANTSDSTATFAGQVTLGLNVALTQHISAFFAYQYLYLATANYAFGSTIYPAHAPTSSWQVNVAPQQYNIGTIGVQFNT